MEEDWPKDRDVETFREWFEIRFQSMVLDLCAGEIFQEEDDDEEASRRTPGPADSDCD